MSIEREADARRKLRNRLLGRDRRRADEGAALTRNRPALALGEISQPFDRRQLDFGQ